MCVIVFQQLHYLDLDLEGVTRLLGRGETGAPLRAGVSDAWMVDYLAALATICFMLFLGAPEKPRALHFALLAVRSAAEQRSPFWLRS